jgi:Family of unknown function (DUF5989)
MGFVETTGRRFGIVGELFSFLFRSKRGWMAPILVALFLLAVLLILSESSAIFPFIYTMF